MVSLHASADEEPGGGPVGTWMANAELSRGFVETELTATAALDGHEEDTCNLRSMRGTYAVVGHGTIFTQIPGFPPPPVLFAETGTVTFDGAGSFSGAVTVSLNGAIIQPTVSGTYSVGRDCSTSITVSAAGLVIHEEGPIIGRGKEFHVIQTDPGWVRTLVGKKL
jgi:hypothetical protein